MEREGRNDTDEQGMEAIEPEENDLLDLSLGF